MPNAFLDAQVYANSMLYLVKNELVMGRLVNSKFVNQVNDENGLTVRQKRPSRFVAKNGETLQTQDSINGFETITVDQYKNVHLSIGDLEYIQSYNDLVADTNMKSAAYALAQSVDSYLHEKTLEFSNWVGTPGNAIGAPAQFNRGPERLDLLAVPQTDRGAALFTTDAYGISDTLIDNNSISDVARSALERSQLPLLSSTRAYMTQMSQQITLGSRSNGTVDGASQNVNYRDVKDSMTQTLNVAGLGGAGTVAAGEVFTIAGVQAVNPRTAESYDYLQQFTVTAAATAGGSGDAALTITPPIIVPGSGSGSDIDVNTAFATVNAAPANGAAVTFLGTASTSYRYSTAFHKEAISLVFAKLRNPFTGEASFATDPDTGVSVRYWRGSDISTGKHIHRWDMVFGASAMDPLLGVRISGT
ncbi:MAG: hypothetical protein MJH10_11030 [Epibacterium sp.]|nr:hypothetical protein [Epibacterium sp.]NQX74079.1 hypothetical protein [Epibacterium sp.]